MAEQILAGKTGVVFGVANKRSIAWAIAKAWAAAGATLIFNYQGERLKDNVEELVGEFGEGTPLYPCDVSKDEEIESFFGKVRGHTERVDLLLHSVAFAPKEALEGDFVSTTREAFRTAHDISAYSLVALSRASRAAHDRGRQHRGDDLLRRRKSGAALQRHGRGEGQPGSEHPLSRLRSGFEKNPGQLHLGRPGKYARGARDQRVFVDAETLPGKGAAGRSCDPAEIGQTGCFSRATARRRSPGR